ncbi:DUF4407 domain-containing protein [Winogradskyella sp. PC-19]|uniref:DUF4407 domain-containing protein n=1 Tax=Winogradskyella sp. PC-19 TaxID=754417 RepID=UPI001E53AEFA|nr:DUF4407 domain-containing protein [Winogradskyella sp. PC-19]
MNRDYYHSPKPGKVMQWLWKAAGSDAYILKRSTYNDQVKYACLGGIVVATGFMAALAGGYAVYTIFEPKGSALDDATHIPTALMACIFGVIWGLIIFNIDRFIVAATGKGDGTEAITWKEFTGSIPRIIMGLVIAITISKPMEIRMFKSEIDAELHQTQLEKQKEYEEATTANYDGRFLEIEKGLKKIEIKRVDLIERIKKAEQDYSDQLNGKVPGTTPGNGPLSKALKSQIDKLELELDDFDETNKSELTRLNSEKLKLQTELDSELAKNKEVAGGLDGLLERIHLAHEVAGFWITFFITLLFIVIELTPIFFKMMLIKSPYDYMSDNVNELLKADQGIQIKYDYYKDKKGQERNLIINHQAKKKVDEKMMLIKAQTELSDYIIEKWKEKEKQNIDQNVEDYISEA